MHEMYRLTYRCSLCWQEEVEYSTFPRPSTPKVHHHPSAPVAVFELRSVATMPPAVTDFQDEINRQIKKLAKITETPPHVLLKETNMTYPNPSDYSYPRLVPSAFARFLDDVQHHVKPKTAEQIFRELDVQPGDRVRLTYEIKPRGGIGTLESVVAGVKVKDRKSQIRLEGFGHTGGKAGGQHVWFAVENYKIEVLKKAFRWTERDRVIAELVGGPAGQQWATLPETRRTDLRAEYGTRADRIIKLLKPVDGVE